jgi:hypothetical protein
MASAQLLQIEPVDAGIRINGIASNGYQSSEVVRHDYILPLVAGLINELESSAAMSADKTKPASQGGNPRLASQNVGQSYHE